MHNDAKKCKSSLEVPPELLIPCCILSQISAGNFTVIPQTCPGGYHLTEQRELAGSGQGVGMTCECLERTEVIACEENQDSIIVRVSKQMFWVIYSCYIS